MWKNLCIILLKLSAFSLFLMCFIISGEKRLLAEAFPEKTEITCFASFDEAIRIDKPDNIKCEHVGGKIIPDGISGSALQLKDNEYVWIESNSILDSKQGSIILWIRPHWQGNSTNSNPILSFSWDDEQKSYGVLSAGWWDNNKSIYFILNNHLPHTSVKIREISFDRNSWIHLACTWKTGVSGFVRLYVNGSLISKRECSEQIDANLDGKIIIGSDMATPIIHKQWADCDIDELAFLHSPLTTRDIIKIYIEQGFPKHIPARDTQRIIRETRAIYDEGTEWMSESGALNIIKRIKEAGFNVYIPCIWHGRGTRYPSSLAPPEKNIIFLHDDPLERLIAIAHKNSIEVHPWFCVALRQRAFFEELYAPQTPAKAFDVHRNEFRKFITDLVVDVVNRYDVDGINLDFIRTMGVCTCDFCLRSYRNIYNRNLLEDMHLKSHEGGLEYHLQDWQDKAVTAIVRDISTNTRREKPDCIISVDGHVHPRYFHPNRQGRRVIKWLNDGLIDYAFHMDYRESPNFEIVDAAKKELADPTRVIFLLGNYDRQMQGENISRDPDAVSTIIKYIQRRWQDNSVGIYCYNRLNEEQINMLKKDVFLLDAVPLWHVIPH